MTAPYWILWFVHFSVSSIMEDQAKFKPIVASKDLANKKLTSAVSIGIATMQKNIDENKE